MENKLPAEMNEQELVNRHEELRFELEERDAEQKVIREELADRLTKEGLNSKPVGEFNVIKVVVVSFPKFLLEKARELGAIKEAVDTEKLKELDRLGGKIEGKQVTISTQIRRIKPKGDNEG